MGNWRRCHSPCIRTALPLLADRACVGVAVLKSLPLGAMMMIQQKGVAERAGCVESAECVAKLGVSLRLKGASLVWNQLVPVCSCPQ